MITLRTAFCTAVFAGAWGCVVPETGPPESPTEPGSDAPALVDRLESVDRPSTPNAEPDGDILAPTELLAFVGEELSFDVILSENATGALRAGVLPGESLWLTDELGGSFWWTPQREDLGDHDLVFLLVDELEQDLVLSQRTVLVAVRTRNSLVEYGF